MQKLNIIINCVRTTQSLQRCLNSISRHSKAWITVNAVCDGNNCIQQTDFPEICVVPIEKSKYISAINELIEKTDASYFMLATPDTVFSSRFFDSIEAELNTAKNDCIVYNIGIGNAEKNNNKETEKIVFSPLYDDNATLTLERVFNGIPCVWNTVFKRETALKNSLRLNGLSMVDQYAYCAEFFLRGKNYGFTNEICAYKKNKTSFDKSCYNYFYSTCSEITRIKSLSRRTGKKYICDGITRDILLPVVERSYSDEKILRRLYYRSRVKRMTIK